MVHGVNSGHPGGSLGCTDFFTALFFKVMNHKHEFTMDAKNEDVFILYKRKRIIHKTILKEYIAQYGESNIGSIIKRAT